jgi:drug/metabolite transporter (DMT)-like permease
MKLKPLSRALPDAAQSHMIAYILLTLAPLFWAGNFVIGRALRNDFAPIELNFGRWLVALVILLPLSYGQMRRAWPVLYAEWKLIVLLGLLGVAAFNTLVYQALNHTQALNASLFTSAVPIVIAMASWLLFRDTLTPFQIFGISISLVGVLVMITRGDMGALLHVQFNPGDLWMLLAVPVWGVYSALLKRRPAELPQLGLLTATVVVGVVAMVPLVVWQANQGLLVKPTLENALGLLYVGVFASVLAFLCWNSGLITLGPNRGGTFIHLIPIFGALLSIVFLDEQIATYHLVGATLVFAGIALTNVRQHGANRTQH